MLLWASDNDSAKQANMATGKDFGSAPTTPHKPAASRKSKDENEEEVCNRPSKAKDVEELKGKAVQSN